MSLPTRQIGKNGPHVAAMGFGLMGLSGFYGAIENDEERFKVLDRALELGATNWDSSDIYMDSEDLIGKWFKRTGKRNEIFLATKFGIVRTGALSTVTARGDPEYVRKACESSLKRLGVDSIDLFYAHRVDKNIPIEITVGAMAELVKEGKVKYLGLSECSADTLRRAHAIHPIAAVQIEFSLFFLDIESPEIGLLKACRELGVSVVAYSPLGRGLLTGSIRGPEDFPDGDVRKFFPRFTEANFPKILELVDRVSEIAKGKGITSGQAALAWLMAQGVDIIPIPGTKKIKYLEENVAAANITLTPEEIKDIREASNIANNLSGDRYPPGLAAYIFTDTPPLN